jgi:hypothetical protein
VVSIAVAITQIRGACVARPRRREGSCFRLKQNVEMLDHLYPQIRIDFVTVRGSFGPELVETLANRVDPRCWQ